MPPLNVVFLGSDRWSVPSLEAIVRAGHLVRLVVTATPKPSGRGHRTTPTAVAEAARSLSLTLLETDDVRGERERRAIADAGPDVLAVVAFGQLLPPDVLAAARLAPINLHFSLLPRHRGASPVRGALRAGDAETGVTTIRMVDELDAGPVYLRRSEAVRERDDAGTLGDRLALLGADLLVETIDRLADGDLEPRDQDPEAVTWTRELRSGDRRIDWSASAIEVVRTCRALSPDPGALTRFRGADLKILRADAISIDERETTPPSDAAARVPGKVIAVDRDGISVACGNGVARLVEVVPSGRARMAAADFARGARIELGEKLGSSAAPDAD